MSMLIAGICYRWMANSTLNVNSLLSKLFKAAGFEVDVRTKARSQNGGLLKLIFLASNQYSNEISISKMILLIYFDRNERDMISRLLRHNLTEMRHRFKAIKVLSSYLNYLLIIFTINLVVKQIPTFY